MYSPMKAWPWSGFDTGPMISKVNVSPSGSVRIDTPVHQMVVSDSDGRTDVINWVVPMLAIRQTGVAGGAQGAAQEHQGVDHGRSVFSLEIDVGRGPGGTTLTVINLISKLRCARVVTRGVEGDHPVVQRHSAVRRTRHSRDLQTGQSRGVRVAIVAQQFTHIDFQMHVFVALKVVIHRNGVHVDARVVNIRVTHGFAPIGISHGVFEPPKLGRIPARVVAFGYKLDAPVGQQADRAVFCVAHRHNLQARGVLHIGVVPQQRLCRQDVGVVALAQQQQ